MRPASFGSHDLYIETMRFFHSPATTQKIILRGEGKSIDLAAQPGQFDTQLNILRPDRLVVTIGVDMEFGFGAIFKDGDFNREIAVAQHPTAMGTALFLGLFRAMLFMIVRGRGFATPGKPGGGEQQGRKFQQGGHQRFSALARRDAWRPVSRSSRAPSRW